MHRAPDLCYRARGKTGWITMLRRAANLPAVPAQPRVFKDLERVRLTRDVSSQLGTLPKGSTGTILMVFAEGEAYEIEFARPVEAMVTVKAGDLEPV